MAFSSLADNLVGNDTNGIRDVFVHDRERGVTVRVSVDSQGGEANSRSDNPSISGDGQQVAYVSYASNLVPNDTNDAPDIFVTTLSQSPEPDLVLSLSTNQTSYSTGDFFNTSVTVDNPGLDSVFDFYFGAILPDRKTTVFFTDTNFNYIATVLSDPSSYEPIVEGTDLSDAFLFDDPDFFSMRWADTHSPGIYTLFLAAGVPGAFFDGRVDEGDLVEIELVNVEFAP